MDDKGYLCAGGPWDGNRIKSPPGDYFEVADMESPVRIISSTEAECTMRTGGYRWSGRWKAFTWRGWNTPPDTPAR